MGDVIRLDMALLCIEEAAFLVINQPAYVRGELKRLFCHGNPQLDSL
jgi:hypothetical protein